VLTALTAHLNFGVCLIVTAVIAILFGLQPVLQPKRLELLDFRTNPNTTVSVLSYGLSRLLLVYFYFNGKLGTNSVGLNLLVLDAGNLATLLSAVALSQGTRMDFSKLKYFAAPAVFLALWDMCVAPFSGNVALLKLGAIAPSAVLAHLATIFLGWMFVVRWGAHGLWFLALAVLNSLLQLPGYYTVFVMPPTSTPNPIGSAIFFGLAILKIPMALIFIGFLISHIRPAFDAAKYWPDGNVEPDVWVYRPIAAVVSLLAAAVSTALIGAIVSKPVEKEIERLFAPTTQIDV